MKEKKSEKENFNEWLYKWRKNYLSKKPKRLHEWQIQLETIKRVQKELERIRREKASKKIT